MQNNDLISRSALWKKFDEAHLFDDGNPRHIAQQIVEEAPAVEAVPVNLRIEIDHNDFAEEVAETAKERGWFRKRFFCPCGQLIKVESWEKEHCFGSGTVLRENKMPKHCPNCGAKMDGAKDG